MERQTQSSISTAIQCERCVLKSHVIYEERVVFCPCSGYLPAIAEQDRLLVVEPSVECLHLFFGVGRKTSDRWRCRAVPQRSRVESDVVSRTATRVVRNAGPRLPDAQDLKQQPSPFERFSTKH